MNLPAPTVQSLAEQLGSRKGVLWAVESSKLVWSKTNPADQLASQAAEAWVKNPNSTTQAAAASAAKKTDFQGPGAWAAQAAAWAHPGGQSPGGAAAGGGAAGAGASSTHSVAGIAGPPSTAAHGGAPTGSLVLAAVAGSVSIAAALLVGAKPPVEKPPPAPGTPAAPKSAMQGMPKIPAAPKLEPPPPPKPAEAAKIAKIQKPFIDLGNKILLDQSLFAK